MSSNQSGILARLYKEKMVAILRGVPPEKLIQTASALADGGIGLIEVTMNSVRAAHGISMLREKLPHIYVGAGTVINTKNAEEALTAGAQFLISPNVDRDVISFAVERGVSIWPGAMTPTEIFQAWEAGAEAIKLFPASSLGVDYLRSVRAPFAQIPILATGGIHLTNMQSYLAAGACAVGIGSEIVDKQALHLQQYDRMTALAKKYTSLAKGDLQ